MNKIKYNNPFVDLDNMVKCLENYSIKYWVTLKFPKVKILSIEVVKEAFLNLFVYELRKKAGDSLKLILGVIEENYNKNGFHVHVLIACNKDEHLIRSTWIEVLIKRLSILYTDKSVKDLFVLNIELSAKSLIYIDNLVVIKKSLKNLVFYMFKFFGFNKMHGYCYYNSTNNDLIKYIETEDYRNFQKTNYNLGLSFIILIYSIGHIFSIKLKVEYILKLLVERNDQVNDILKLIDEYLSDNQDYFFGEDKSTERINKLMFQITCELIQGDFFYVIRPKYTFIGKEKIYFEFKEQMELLDTILVKNNKSLPLFKMLMEHINETIPIYKHYGKTHLVRANLLLSNYGKWLFDLDNEAFFQEMVYCAIDWILSQCYNSKTNIEPITQGYIIKRFSNILKFYIGPLLKIKEWPHLTDDFCFIFFKVLVRGIEKIHKLPNLLQLIKVLDFETNEYTTAYLWNTIRNKKLFKDIKLLVDGRKKENVTELLFHIFNVQVLQYSQLVFGTFFVIPKKWKLDDKAILEDNYTGAFILNSLFKFCSLIHKDNVFLGSLKFIDSNEFIENINKYQSQTFLYDNASVMYVTSKYKEASSIKEYIRSNGQKEELKKQREKRRMDFIKEIKGKEIWYGVYLDGRGRIYATGTYNYQNDKELRKIITIKNEYKIEKRQEIKEKIKKEEESIRKEMMWKEIEEEKKETYVNKWLRYKDGNASGTHIATIILRIKELYKKYYMEEKKEEIYDYYMSILRKYVEEKNKEMKEEIEKESKKWRRAIKRAIMTQIYGAKVITMWRYIRKGLEEEKIEVKKEKEFIQGFVKYINETEMGKNLNIFKKIIKGIIPEGSKPEEIEKILKVKAYGREMNIVYCDSNKEEKIIRIYKKRNKITLRVIDKEEVNAEKTATAYFVNVVHFIDAGIAYYIMKYMLKNDKPIIMIHDSFGTLYSDAEELEQVYILALKNEEENLKMHNLFKNVFLRANEIYEEIKSGKEIGYMSKKEKEMFKVNYLQMEKLKEASMKNDLIWAVIKNSNLLKDE